MKYIFLIAAIICNQVTIAQKKIFLQAQIAPKITINNNSGAGQNGQNNAPDARSAMSFGLGDYSVIGGFWLNKSNVITLGLGKYRINQIFRPSYNSFGGNYQNIHKYLDFMVVPLSFEHLFFKNKKFNVFGCFHISFIGDVFAHKNNKFLDGQLKLKNSSIDTNTNWSYYYNYVNTHTFNILYGFSTKVEYTLDKRCSLIGGVQFMQGFRPLISSVVYFGQYGSTVSSVISNTNGQSIMLNIGVRYNF